MSAPIPDEQAALLAAIVADPDEDTPRLVYADWLQDHGDEEQARFIRETIELSRASFRDGVWWSRVKRLRELAEERSLDWYGPLGLGETVAVNRYERGFPYRVTFVGPDDYFAAAPRVLSLLPIRGVRINDDGALDDAGLRELAGTWQVSRLTDLRLVGHTGITLAAWRKLFRSPHVAGLYFLGLADCDLGEAEAQELASAPPLAGLTDLDLSNNSIGVEGARAILDSPYLRKRLEVLWLEHNFFGGEDGEEDVLGELEAWLGDGLRTHSSPDDTDDTDFI